MKKIIFFFSLILLIAGSAITPAFGGDLELSIKESRCVDEGLFIRYSVTNERDFDRNGISIAFKVIVEDKPLVCREIKTTIPKNADGSNIDEVLLESQCEGKPYTLMSRIFYYRPRYRIEEWFSGCPGYDSK